MDNQDIMQVEMEAEQMLPNDNVIPLLYALACASYTPFDWWDMLYKADNGSSNSCKDPEVAMVLEWIPGDYSRANTPNGIEKWRIAMIHPQFHSKWSEDNQEVKVYIVNNYTQSLMVMGRSKGCQINYASFHAINEIFHAFNAATPPGQQLESTMLTLQQFDMRVIPFQISIRQISFQEEQQAVRVTAMQRWRDGHRDRVEADESDDSREYDEDGELIW
jgi:hypothetical protein